MSIAPVTEATAPVNETEVVPTEGQAPAVEPPKAKDDFAERLELLTKKQRAMWRQEQQIKEREKQIEERLARADQFEQKKAKAKQNPLEALNDLGLTYDEITEYFLNGGKPTEKSELQAVRDEIERMRKERDEEKNQQKDQQTKAQQQAEVQAIEKFKSEISDFLTENKDTYELTATREAVEDVFSTINDSYRISYEQWVKDGKYGDAPQVMSIKEAAEIVEEFYETEVMRLTETNKLKQKLGLKPKDPEPSQSGKPPSKTLTNNMASTAATVVPPKTDEDRMRRAMAKLEGVS